MKEEVNGEGLDLVPPTFTPHCAKPLFRIIPGKETAKSQ
jgi:hypothetical protein